MCVQLLETKSTDRSQTLLHYIANVVRDKYPAVSPFYNELHYVDKAAAGECQPATQSLLVTDPSSGPSFTELRTPTVTRLITITTH